MRRSLGLGLAIFLVGVAHSLGAIGVVEQDAPPVEEGRLPAAAADTLKAEAAADVAAQAETLGARHTAEGEQQLDSSADDFADLDRPEALAAVQDHHEEVLAASDPDPLDGAPAVDHFINDHVAVLDNRAGEPADVVASMLPLRVADEDGSKAPVDLTLHDAGSWFEPVNPIVGVRIWKALSQGAELTDGGITVRLVSDADPTPVVRDNTAFWANVDTDTDLLVGPRPSGIESYLQVRSAASPERYRFRIGLPEGADLRISRSDSRSLEVVRDGETVAAFSPPVAWDADQQPVESAASIDGNDVVIDVPHRGEHVAYPLIVDPTDSYAWNPSAGKSYAGWTFVTPDPVRFSQFFGDAYLGGGLYQRTLNGPQGQTPWSYTDGELSYWRYTTPPGAAISKLTVTGSEHESGAPYGGTTCGFDGVAMPGAWTPGTTHTPGSGWDLGGDQLTCLSFGPVDHTFGGTTTSGNGVLGNSAIVGILIKGTAARGYFMRYFSGAQIQLRDPGAPTLNITGIPSGWTNDSAGTVVAAAADDGLGVNRVTLTGAPGFSSACKASYIGRCPATAQTSAAVGTYAEGITSLSATASDIAKNVAVPASSTLKFDKTPPTLELAGSLWDSRDTTITDGSYTVSAAAGDAITGRATAGVTKIEVTIDGMDPDPGVYSAQQPCNADCSLNLAPATVDTTALSSGLHTFTVTATDGAGNAKVSSFGVTVAHVDVSAGLTRTALTPTLTSTITAQEPTASPGQTVHYSVTTTNAGGKLELAGSASARYTGQGTATVAYGSIELETRAPGAPTWQPLTSWRTVQPGYAPLDGPGPGGLSVSAAPRESGGVEYASTVNKVLGTRIDSGASAAWDVTASATLSAGDVRRLVDPTQTEAVRLSVSFELADDHGERIADNAAHPDITPDVRTQDAHARDAVVTIGLPDGSQQALDSQVAPALSDLGPGDGASLSATGIAPAPASHGAGETDMDYLERLQAADDADVFATAAATARSDGAGVRDAQGTLSQEPEHAVSGADARGGVKRVLPVISLADVGSAAATPGGRVSYTVTAANTGHLDATDVELEDQLDAEAPSSMPGAPTTVAIGASATATRDADVPSIQPAGTYTHRATVTWHDSQGNLYGPVSDSADTEVTIADIPTAPSLDPSGVTGIDEANAFLTEGSDPVQTGLTTGTITTERASVIRGRLVARDGVPIADATVTVPDHPEFGQATTRADGGIYLLVNAGLPLRLHFHKPGYLDADRLVTPRAQDYTWLDDVALVEEDPVTTGVDLGLGSPVQIARGRQETDDSGTRQATVIFQPGTMASLQMPDGATQPISHLTLHLTEFTVGERGPAAMPADLPPTSGYTYATAFEADEVRQAGATGVTFSTPAAGYVENFLGFPVGAPVPSGAYDSKKGAWVPAPNGRVVKILTIAGGQADLDIDGSGQPATASQLTDLGVTDAERQQLAALYQPGEVLWRVPMAHFSIWDWNFALGFPSGATGPPANGPDGGPDVTTDSDGGPCTDEGGSTIECENQVLHEEIGVQGTGMSLGYSSGRQQGRTADRKVDVRISGSSPPGSLKAIQLDLQIAGQRYRDVRGPEAGQTFTYMWDGKDGYGRRVQGAALGVLRVGYVYDMTYGGGGGSFADFGTTDYSVTSRQEGILWREVPLKLGNFDERRAGTGGWSLSAHHVYDPVGRTLYLGDGTTRQAGSVNSVIDTYASGIAGPTRDVLAAPDGSIYYSTFRDQIFRIRPDGTQETVAGTAGNAGFSGDGGPATDALITRSLGLALGPDGSLYFADSESNRVRKIGPDGIITTIAGNGQNQPFQRGDGGPASQAVIDFPTAVQVAPDGTVFIGESGPVSGGSYGFVRKVSPDGTISTIAGSLNRSGYAPSEGEPALSAYVNGISDLALDPDGSLIVADSGHCRIRRIDTSGRVYTVAGGTSSVFTCATDGDGGPADAAHLEGPVYMSRATDGALYLTGANRVRRIGPNGIITTVAGTGTAGFSGDGGAATQAQISSPQGVSIGLNGDLYVVDDANGRIRKVAAPLPGMTGQDFAIPSSDGSELFRFDEHGRHLATIDTHTGKTLDTFAYDDAGHLRTVTDLDGDTTTIDHALNGTPTTITGPFGQQTTLHVDADGYLDAVTDAGGATTRMHYRPGGLMDSITSPGGHMATMTWDALGRLEQDVDADGATKTYTRSERPGGRTITTTTGTARAKTNAVDVLGDGTVRRTVAGYDGLTSTVDLKPNGSRSATRPDGTANSYTLGADPRFDMNAAFVASASLNTPGGRHLVTSTTRSATLTTPSDPLSLETETETSTINGRSASASYDAAQRKLTATTAVGRTATVTFDANGRPSTEHFPGDLDVATAYDTHGRVASVTQGTRSETYTYDTLGRPATVTDAANHVTTFSWDASDRLTGVSLPDGRTIGYGYDADGNLSSVTPAGRPAHTFAATGAGRPQDATAPAAPYGGAGTHLHYNPDGLLDRVTRPDGTDIAIDRDGAGRIATITRPEGGAVEYHYSPTTGQISSLDSPDSETVSYDHDGPLITSFAFSGPLSGTVSAAYDDDLRLASLAVNGADTVGYSYDADSLLTNVGSLGYSRDADNGRVTSTGQGTVSSTYGYDGYGDLQALTWTGAGGTLLGFDYARDALGRVIAATESGTLGTRSRAYGYDPAGRLVTADENGEPALRVSYDDNSNPVRIQRGNDLPAIASYDDQDRLVRFGATTYTYDLDGQLKTATTGSQTTGYAFDGLGRLTKITLPDGKTISYVLDGLGRRVARKVNGTVSEQFLYDAGLNPIAELDANGNLVSRFVYGEDPTTPEYMTRGGHTYRFVTDQRGSVRAIVDTADGSIAEQLDYDPVGTVTQDTQPGFQPFGYAGGLDDADSGLWHFGARDYDPQTLRWLSKDPLGFAGGDTSLYGYSAQDPVNLADPSGLSTLGGCVGGSVSLIVHISVETCIQVSTSFEIGGSVAGGAGVGLSTPAASLGLGGQVSNADHISDLSGPFTEGGVHGGGGPDIAVNGFQGESANGLVSGAEAFIGAGAGFGAHGSHTYTFAGGVNPVDVLADTFKWGCGWWGPLY